MKCVEFFFFKAKVLLLIEPWGRGLNNGKLQPVSFYKYARLNALTEKIPRIPYSLIYNIFC